MYSLAGKMLAVIAVYALPVVLPINLMGQFEDTDNLLTRMSMSNVGIDSPYLCVKAAWLFFRILFSLEMKNLVSIFCPIG